MKWTVETKLAIGFIIAVSSLCAVSVLSYRTTQEFAEAGKALAHSQEILRELENTLLVVKEAEARELALLAAGKEDASPAPTVAPAIHAHFLRLKELAAGGRNRLQGVQELERLVAREVQVLQEMALSPEPGSVRAIDSHLIFALDNEIRTRAATIADSENATLRLHAEAVKITARQSSLAFLGLAILTALFIGLAFYRMLCNMRERREAIEQLRHSEERYRLLAENSLDLIALLDIKGNLIYASPSHETLLGHDPAWLVGRGFPALIHPEDFSLLRLAIAQLPESGPGKPIDVRLRQSSGQWLDVELLLSPFSIGSRSGRRILLSARSISDRKRAEQEREKLIHELQEAFAKIKVLSGFIPICASCKKIRDDQGYWNQLEAYIQSHTEAQFSHGICPDCASALYPDYFTKGA